ncbi:MAG: flagellar assembly protein FliW [Candidatus Nitrospinota bacterium M3_3B_026]
MRIKSARAGEIEIDAEGIITLPEGIIGFPDYKRYVELEFLEGSPLRLLQAVDEPNLGFIVMDPALFMPDYRVNLSREEMKSLNAEKLSDLAVRVVVTIPEDPYQMTANLQGPLVMNKATKLARQMLNNEGGYTTKHRIIQNTESATMAG